MALRAMLLLRHVRSQVDVTDEIAALPDADVARDYARRRAELLARSPRWACLTCLLEFKRSSDYHDHLEQTHSHTPCR
jgi:hypothetical protein